MAEPTTGTQVPTQGGGAFPPFDTTTFPSQIFWLAITFVVLFAILSRFIGPKLGKTIGERKGRVANDLEAAGRHRSDAEAALAAYQQALAEARARAHAASEENRRQIEAEVEKAKAEAEGEAKAAAARAEAAIAATRAEAARHVTKVAQDAAAAIVTRLIGESVSAEEAETAVRATGA
ncbi:MAG: ATP F0F1 synthase subunit B [Alphaproteobacteria bacterium]|nr:ATP F0F1 synthase subunit B [Alphaproteobacteria bacterium]